MLPTVPLCEVSEEPKTCCKCQGVIGLDDEVLFAPTLSRTGDGLEAGDEMAWCVSCAGKFETEVENEATVYAKEHCKLTGRPHGFDSRSESHDGYMNSYTEHAVGAANRHECTNYDKLISDLDRFSAWDSIRYLKIRERCEELIEDALLDFADEDDLDFDDEDE